MYFVRDGHHRVSVFRSLGIDSIDADVRLVRTLIEPTDVHLHSDLSDKDLRRLFAVRVPLGKNARCMLTMSSADDYPRLAEMVEAWAARLMFAEGELMTRKEAAQRWYQEEFEPVSKLIADGELARKDETPADAYLRVACERYDAVRAHVWNPDVIDLLGQRK